jgi:hypothetical protein
MTTFEKLNFDNQALKQLPVDSSPDYLIQRPIPNACFHRVKPTSVDEPKLVAISEDALKEHGFRNQTINCQVFMLFLKPRKADRLRSVRIFARRRGGVPFWQLCLSGRRIRGALLLRPSVRVNII